MDNTDDPLDDFVDPVDDRLEGDILGVLVFIALLLCLLPVWVVWG